MKKILALGGSTSATSINRQLASFASQLVTNAETTLIDLNDYEAPIYKPVLLMSASTGARGGASVLAYASNYFQHAGASEVITFSFPKFFDNFSQGNIINHELNTLLSQKVLEFQDKL